jgi:hypothetical protein
MTDFYSIESALRRGQVGDVAWPAVERQLKKDEDDYLIPRTTPQPTVGARCQI